ncbi:hypothetical protein HDU67_000881 [Dinochytrium kinnereticum]|nr:hypothetical protein HDU67_000881 [Dinochytrium kinnereticum]
MSTPQPLLRIISLVQGDPPDRAFITHISPSSPISSLRQLLCHRLGGIPDFSLTLFALSTPILIHRIPSQHRASLSLIGELGGKLVVDPFLLVRDVFLEGVADFGGSDLVGPLDSLHLVVVVERDPGGPPSYEDVRDNPLTTFSTDEKKHLHQLSVLSAKILKEDGGASSTIKKISGSLPVPPIRTNSRNLMMPHLLEVARAAREVSAPLTPPLRDTSLHHFVRNGNGGGDLLTVPEVSSSTSPNMRIRRSFEIVSPPRSSSFRPIV